MDFIGPYIAKHAALSPEEENVFFACSLLGWCGCTGAERRSRTSGVKSESFFGINEKEKKKLISHPSSQNNHQILLDARSQI